MATNAEKRGQRHWYRAGWVVGAIMLLVALVAKQFLGEPAWIGNLAQTGTLLIGVGIAVELSSRMTGQAAYRTAVGLALSAAFLLGWVNSGVGIIGSEDDAANLMYGGVIAVGVIGAVIARLKPEGMARTLFATALAQALVAAIALVGRLSAGTLEVVTINGFFIALFIGSAVLFWKSRPGRPDQGHQNRAAISNLTAVGKPIFRAQLCDPKCCAGTEQRSFAGGS